MNRQALAERVRFDEVGERLLTVDLDDRDALPVPGLELRVAVDLDEVELEPELRLRLSQHLERALAEMALRRAVERDAGYGYRPLVVVASATRCTAIP